MVGKRRYACLPSASESRRRIGLIVRAQAPKVRVARHQIDDLEASQAQHPLFSLLRVRKRDDLAYLAVRLRFTVRLAAQ